jgi:hypothetical protein
VDATLAERVRGWLCRESRVMDRCRPNWTLIPELLDRERSSLSARVSFLACFVHERLG